ncbi:Protein of unknown function [Cotesia congregata]|uniref:C2H2-type domain-containing protein n=1 Tax=Cotesia congregata TaxID=51543 RepID=A0A8J2HJ68_COTCN|nr:Protein of unknown function [Cotesia congregata]
METSFDYFPGYEETFPVKEEDDLNQLMIKNIKFACNNPKCNLTFNSERQRDKHSFDCLKNNLKPEKIALDQSAKFRDEFKENKEKIPSKNPVKPLKPKKTSKKIVQRYKIIEGRYFCCKCSRSYTNELTTMKLSFNDFPSQEETFSVKEDDDLNQLMIKNIKYACNNLECNLTFSREHQRDKHSFDCLKNNLQPEEITFDQRNYPLTVRRFDDYYSGLQNFHSNMNLNKYPCVNAHCNSVFKDENTLRKHVKYICGKPPRYQCGYCEYRSHWAPNVRTHSKALHPDLMTDVIELYNPYPEEMGTFVCPNCSQRYKFKKGLDAHLKNLCGR